MFEIEREREKKRFSILYKIQTRFVRLNWHSNRKIVVNPIMFFLSFYFRDVILYVHTQSVLWYKIYGITFMVRSRNIIRFARED